MSINVDGRRAIDGMKDVIDYVEAMEGDLREMEAAYDELIEKNEKLEDELRKLRDGAKSVFSVSGDVYRDLKIKYDYLLAENERLRKANADLREDYDDACCEIDDLRTVEKELMHDLAQQVPVQLMKALHDMTRDANPEGLKSDVLHILDLLKTAMEGNKDETGTDPDD